MIEYPTCAECGAPAIDGLTCWEQLGMLISWEHNDPALRAEHFLIVTSYNLQHPAQFTVQALSSMHIALLDYLEHGITVKALRQRASKTYEGSTRVLRPVGERTPVLRSWPMTIADVYLPDKPEGAVARVRVWASSLRSEL